MLGETWPAVVGVFRALPPADVGSCRDGLDRTVIEIAHRFDEWLSEIGFGCEELDDGGSCFRVYEHEDWATCAIVAGSPPTNPCSLR